MRSSIILAIAATFTSCLAAMTSQVWNFTDIIIIENSALPPNGRLLLTAFVNASLCTLATPSGINGIKILGRIPITEVGYKAGNADFVTYSNSPNKYDWGHFVIDPAGNIFAAQTPNASVQIFPDETYTTLAGGSNSICFTDPLRSQSVRTGKPSTSQLKETQ
ncbi:hypothetical protein SCUP234_10128 [Seiridium cupressi]